ncbi:hypothetical protein [Sphingopyxis sp. UBA6734]|jgi:hypothetical protein|uniref:hypothetical protein n=1 Tax=Sphingopyxis sp. UBA6734 TaxID=1947539 RepID=UPI0008B0C60A|nr:hypothetical protein [Sphingopyxis sp. UBA6734]OHD04184.1 MAG: hypothetical protein A2885_19420 [Sphingopyxis sp. RIFCSPHIGHO2_01_FULL_65_24]
MMRHRSETWLAWFSLFATTVHFTLETWYHMVWGQPLQALLVDYISVALMIFGAVTSLRIRPRSAAGLLAAAWTYNLGFGWRSAFGRLEALERGASPVNGEASFVLPIVAASLMIVAIVMVWALFLAWRQALSPSPANG